MMKGLAFLLLPSLVLATLDSVTVQVKAGPINGTVEYSTICKSCPYNLCTDVKYNYGKDNVTLTCWAKYGGIFFYNTGIISRLTQI